MGGCKTYCEESAEYADHDGEEYNQEQTECGAFVASGLGVDDGERKGSVAVDDGAQVVDAVGYCDGVEEGR